MKEVSFLRGLNPKDIFVKSILRGPASTRMWWRMEHRCSVQMTSIKMIMMTMMMFTMIMMTMIMMRIGNDNNSKGGVH